MNRQIPVRSGSDLSRRVRRGRELTLGNWQAGRFWTIRELSASPWSAPDGPRLPTAKAGAMIDPDAFPDGTSAVPSQLEFFCLRGDSMAAHDDDLFQHTSMSFGEHLEELRAALFKAVIALVVGFAIGLFFAAPIVRAIELPLKDALADFYQKRAFEQLRGELPPDLVDDPAMSDALSKLIYEDGLMPEERFVAPGSLLDMLRERYPESFRDIKLPEEKPSAAAADKAKPAQQAAAPAATDSQPAAEKAQAALAKAPPELSKDKMIRLLLWRPLADDERMKLDALGVQEPFVIYIKAGFLAGAVISQPVRVLLHVAVRGGGFVSAREEVHPRVPAVFARPVLGRRIAGILLRVSAGVELLFQYCRVPGHRNAPAGSPTGCPSCCSCHWALASVSNCRW